MADWLAYPARTKGKKHTVVGNVQVMGDVESPQLGNARDLLVYLPPSYKTGESRYPVIYLHDGQNLFDAVTSFAGEWLVDETMEALSEEGYEAIMVGISNTKDRLNEYSPFRDGKRGGGRGDLYLDFIVQTVKPLIDSSLRTLADRENTGIMGSSMGGLISLYAFFRRSQIFGFAGAMSPSLWFGRDAIYDYIENVPFTSGRIYLDAGTREYGEGHRWTSIPWRSRRYYASIRRMNRLLARKGYRPRRELLYVEEQWANHEEAAWARRLPQALRFLLGHLRPKATHL